MTVCARRYFPKWLHLCSKVWLSITSVTQPETEKFINFFQMCLVKSNLQLLQIELICLVSTYIFVKMQFVSVGLTERWQTSLILFLLVQKAEFDIDIDSKNIHELLFTIRRKLLKQLSWMSFHERGLGIPNNPNILWNKKVFPTWSTTLCLSMGILQFCIKFTNIVY